MAQLSFIGQMARSLRSNPVVESQIASFGKGNQFSRLQMVLLEFTKLAKKFEHILFMPGQLQAFPYIHVALYLHL